MEKAEKLARGAALKWASGVFYRPEKLEGLGHYRNRETQRNSSIQSRLKVGVCHVPPNGCSHLSKHGSHQGLLHGIIIFSTSGKNLVLGGSLDWHLVGEMQLFRFSSLGFGTTPALLKMSLLCLYLSFKTMH